MWYVQGTLSYGLLYAYSSNDELVVGYSDSDWGGDINGRKNISSFVFYMGGMAITWSSIVTLSTCEAEYVVASSCTCHAVWLRKLLNEINSCQKDAMKIHLDSKSAITLAKNPVHHERVSILMYDITLFVSM
ncbi:hypothetical protein Dimus_038781 [Dionaea muscipula]